MATRFIIEDTDHAEPLSQHGSLAEAWVELRRLSGIPWDQAPNIAPCTDWRSCGRSYEIIEFDTSLDPWREVQRVSGFGIRALGVVWAPDAQRDEP